MKLTRGLIIPTLFGFALMPLVPASAEELHHQPDAATEAPAATDQQPGVVPPPSMTGMMGQPSQGMPMTNMMGQGGMGMMDMMGHGTMPMAGGMANPDMPMLDMGAHLEGRIAFLRAELGITEAQTTQWDAFAQALRDSAAKLQQAKAIASQAATESVTFLQRAELQERWLGARLEGVKAAKTAFVGLQTALSDNQKKTAEALLTRPVCFGQMGMM